MFHILDHTKGINIFEMYAVQRCWVSSFYHWHNHKFRWNRKSVRIKFSKQFGFLRENPDAQATDANTRVVGRLTDIIEFSFTEHVPVDDVL